jgi:hypothetical protein
VTENEAACCGRLTAALGDDDVPVTHNPVVREWDLYVFPIGDPERPGWREGSNRQALWFCPFCGDRFPESLRDQYFERLRAIGVEPMDDEVPVEFTSDRWWREAGL